MVSSILFSIAHCHFAHPSLEVLRQIPKNMLLPPNFDVPKEIPVCPGCAKGKMTQRSFPPTLRCASKPFELIHSDLKSFPTVSYHKYHYIIFFLDNYTSSGWLTCLSAKSAAISATCQFLAAVKTQYTIYVQQWMSDAEEEYKSDVFDLILKNKGIKILQSALHTLQQNSHTERFIQTIMKKSETMRLDASLPNSWWEFSVEHAYHVYNRTLMRCLNWQTPSQVLTEIQPSVDHLRVFGCTAYIYIPPKTYANKLSPKSELMTYIGITVEQYRNHFMCSNNTVFISATI